MTINHTFENKTVLIVDDDEGIRESVDAVLELSGIHCVKAASAKAALALLETERPDLILLDAHLRGESGAELTRRLRSAGNALPIIGMSAEEERRPAMIAAGVTAFLDKPFNPNDLIVMINRILNSRKTLAN